MNGTNGTNGLNGTDGVSISNAFVLANGSLNVTLSNGSSFVSGNLTGPAGPQGLTGSTGPAGTNGLNGTNGSIPDVNYVFLQGEFLHTTNPPFFGTAASGGAVAQRASSYNASLHPGVVAFRDSGTAAGGYGMITDVDSVRLNTNTTFNALVSLGTSVQGFANSTSSSVIGRWGFIDSASIALSVDGCSFEWNSSRGNLSGLCVNNNARSWTSTAFIPPQSNWFDLRINGTPSNTTFEIWNENATALLWTNSVTTNIPTSAGRETGVGGGCYENSTAAAQDRCLVDFMAARVGLNVNRYLQR
jgi:hypothetical protein